MRIKLRWSCSILIPPLLLLAVACSDPGSGQPPSAAAVLAQSLEPPVTDTRLTVHTLVREDVFAGFQQNDLGRLARAERNIEWLLANRPDDRLNLLAWQATTALTRAALAHEQERPGEFVEQYRRAQDLFSEAMRLGADLEAVLSIVGGTNAMLADRLPAQERRAAWEQGYAAYQRLWTLQESFAAQLPPHLQGELLSGLAETAQRTGRERDADDYLERILMMMPDTRYATRAQRWLDDPVERAETGLTCQSCHAPGRLAERLADLEIR